MSKQEELIFDFFHIGQELPEHIHTVTEDEIDNFCRSFQEKNPIYLDEASAKKAGFDGRVAPPMLVRYYAHFQNVFKRLHGVIPGHSIHASGEYHFLHPVSPGDVITTKGKVIDKYIKKEKKFLTFELISKNQKGETVVINRHTSVWPK